MIGNASANQVCEDTVINVVSFDGCASHCRLADSAPIDGVAVYLRYLPNELSLRAPISFPEWMLHVNFSKAISCALDEYGAAPTLHLLLLGKFCE